MFSSSSVQCSRSPPQLKISEWGVCDECAMPGACKRCGCVYKFARCPVCRSSGLNKANRAAYRARQYRTNDRYRLAKKLRNRHFMALKRATSKKSSSTSSLVGCTWAELVAHLEASRSDAARVPGALTHIDHIIPLAMYDLRSGAEQLKAFNWRNLRLVTREENLCKGKKLPPPEVLGELWDLMPSDRQLRQVHPLVDQVVPAIVQNGCDASPPQRVAAPPRVVHHVGPENDDVE